MTTIAEKVKSIILEKTPGMFSLYAGAGANNVRFQQGVQQMEKRNKDGQVSKARYVYADGSAMTYTRKSDNAYTLTVN